MTINEIRKFILRTIIYKLDLQKKQLLFNETSEQKDLQFFGMKLTKKTPDLCDAKEHYQSFLRKKTQNQ